MQLFTHLWYGIWSLLNMRGDVVGQRRKEVELKFTTIRRRAQQRAFFYGILHFLYTFNAFTLIANDMMRSEKCWSINFVQARIFFLFIFRWSVRRVFGHLPMPWLIASSVASYQQSSHWEKLKSTSTFAFSLALLTSVRVGKTFYITTTMLFSTCYYNLLGIHTIYILWNKIRKKSSLACFYRLYFFVDVSHTR